MVRALAIGAAIRGWASSRASADGRHGRVVRRRDLVERVQSGCATALKIGASGLGAVGVHHLAARAILAGQEALGEGEVRKGRQVPGFRDRQQRPLELALEEVGVRLQNGELGEPELPLELKSGGETIGARNWTRRCDGRNRFP